MKDTNLIAINDQKLLAAILLRGNSSFVSAMNAVILELINHIVKVHEWVIHGLDGHIGIAHASPKHQPTDSAKAIDTHLARHCCADACDSNCRTKLDANASSYPH